MRVADLLTAIASWLESPQNAALLLAEHDIKCLEKTAATCVEAALVLRAGAAETSLMEPTVETTLTPAALDHLNAIITAFDCSGDEELQKTASALDELLLISISPEWTANYKQAQQDRLDVLKANYDDILKKHEEFRGVKESAKAIDKSPFFQEVRIQDHALQTRTCPDHAGAQMARVGEHMFQCALDKKVFNYASGYTTERGEKVRGQFVGSQAPEFDVQPNAMFDTRQDRLMGGKG
jgi:hypothetical protein